MNLLTYLDKENLDRRLYTYSKINSAITYITTKNIYPLFAESYLEFDALHQRQFNTDVTFLETQPLSVYWKDEKGKSHRYSPDIFTEDKDGNLITDATKFTDTGEINVYITEQFVDGESYLSSEVVVTGIGMSTKEINNLF
jgi:hypothetical protein